MERIATATRVRLGAVTRKRPMTNRRYAVLWPLESRRAEDLALGIGEVALLTSTCATETTTFVHGVAFAAVGSYRDGCTPMGGLGVRAGRVVLVSYQRASVHVSAPGLYVLRSPGPLFIDGNRGSAWTQLEFVVRDMGARLVIIDPTTRALEGYGVQAFVRELAELAKACRCGVLVVGSDTGPWHDAVDRVLHMRDTTAGRELSCISSKDGGAWWSLSLDPPMSGSAFNPDCGE